MSEITDPGERPSPIRVGDDLRLSREQRHLTIESVAERTRIPVRHLQAIEAGSHGDLPAIPYSVGFVKSYAAALGLDGADFARRFRAEAGTVARDVYVPAPYEPADPSRVPSRLIAIVGVILAILVALGYFFWRGSPGHDAVMQAAAGTNVPAATAPAIPGTPQTAVPAPEPTGPIAAGAVAGGPVVLTANRPVWVKIVERGGPTLFMGVIDTGKSYTVPATAADPRLQTGLPEGLRITVGSTVVPQLGPDSKLVKDVSLKPAALTAARTAGPAAPGAAVSADPNRLTPIAGDGVVR